MRLGEAVKRRSAMRWRSYKYLRAKPRPTGTALCKWGRLGSKVRDSRNACPACPERSRRKPVEGIDCLALPRIVSSGCKAESMSPPVVKRINRVSAIGWASVVALGFALALVSGMVAGPAWGDEGPKTTAKKTVYLANPYGFSAQTARGAAAGTCGGSGGRGRRGLGAVFPQ